MIEKFPARSEFNAVLTEINRVATAVTVANPFEEVLLAGNRPFVNRQSLRATLLDLTDPTGSPVLLIHGGRKTGKTFSFYFINHVAPSKNYIANRFLMTRLPKPDQLAEDILGRIGVTRTLQPIGIESAERWSEKLADTVKDAILEKETPRLFVFDDFPVTELPDGSIADIPLPAGTASLIVRLVQYADEELRSYLRVVLVQFPSELSSELDDIALREEGAAVHIDAHGGGGHAGCERAELARLRTSRRNEDREVPPGSRTDLERKIQVPARAAGGTRGDTAMINLTPQLGMQIVDAFSESFTPDALEEARDASAGYTVERNQ